MQQSLILLFLMGQCCLVTCHLYEYHYINEKKNWSEAQQHCRKEYTDLATVSNMTDVTRLYHLMENKTDGAWIGLFKETDGNKTWHWSLPGVEFYDNETKWKTGEPNDAGNGKPEDCVRVDKGICWFDYPCTQTFAFLCCNESNGNETFHLIKEKKTWREAQRYCRENHTDLVSGLTQLKDEELVNLVETSGEDYTFIGLFRDAWTWSDGSGFSFRNWNPDSTSDVENQNSSKQCAVMLKDSKTWETHDCNFTKPFFCYDDKVILIQEKMNWENALYYCREHYHDLVSITNLDEQRWVQEKAKNAMTDFVWTGLRYTCTLDFWFWVSNEPVTYKNWASGHDGDDCDMSGAMETGGRHQWFKRNDNENMYFICSKF